MKTVKRIFRSPTTWVRALLVILALALPVFYGAFAQAHRSETQRSNNNLADVSAKPGDAGFSPAPRPLLPLWTFPFLSPLYSDASFAMGSCARPSGTPPPNSSCGASVRIEALAVHPTDPNTVYAGSEGGLVKSTDGGQNWAYVSDLFISQSIRSIAVDPVNPNIVYVGTGMKEDFSVGIYRSTDAGAHWTQFAANEFTTQRVLKIAIDPATAGSTTSTKLYASVVYGGSGTHTIWKSTNSGQAWAQIRTTTGAPSDRDGWTFYDIAIDPNVSSTLYITSPYPTGGPKVVGVFKSTNGGTTWTPTPIYQFQLLDSTRPSFLSMRRVTAPPSTLYVGYSDAGDHASFAKSTNGGSSWSTLTQPHPQDGWALFAMDVGHPATQDTIVAGVGSRLFYSTDGGSNWLDTANPVPPQPPCNGQCSVHVDLHSVAFCPSNQESNYVGNDGGVYRADDSDGSHGFVTWWSKNQNLPGALMNGVSISSDGHLAMGSQDNGTQVMAGPYAGPTPNPPWTFLHPGDGYKPKIFLDAGNISTIYYVTFYPQHNCNPPGCVGLNGFEAVVRWRCLTGNSCQGGDGQYCNITPPGACTEPAQAYPALFMNSVHPQRIMVGFADLWRSTDSGDNWLKLIIPSTLGGGTVSAVAEAPANPNVIYTVMDATRLLVTTDSGSNWTRRTAPPPSPINAVSVDPCNAKVAYLACGLGVYKTTDYGVTWAIKASGPNLWQDIIVDPGNPSQIFAASAGGVYSGVYLSTNGGETWSNISAGIPPGLGVTSLSLNSTTRKLAASTWGRGAYVLNVSSLPTPGCPTE